MVYRPPECAFSFASCAPIWVCDRCYSTRIRHGGKTNDSDHADPINQRIQKMNWKTTVTGILTLLISAASVARSLIAGEALVDIPTHIAAITAGIGLIFAKDANK